MRSGHSTQYLTGVIIFEERDFPIDEELVIRTAWDYEATKDDPEAEDDEKTLFIVRFPDRFDEAYTERALRSGIHAENEARKCETQSHPLRNPSCPMCEVSGSVGPSAVGRTWYCYKCCFTFD